MFNSLSIEKADSKAEKHCRANRRHDLGDRLYGLGDCFFLSPKQYNRFIDNKKGPTRGPYLNLLCKDTTTKGKMQIGPNRRFIYKNADL